MDVFKIISDAGNQVSSSFLNQIIQSNVGSSPNNPSFHSRGSHQATKSDPLKFDDNSLGMQLRPFLREGAVIAEPSSPFQEYLNKIEDAVLPRLIELSNDKDPKSKQILLNILESIRSDCGSIKSLSLDNSSLGKTAPIGVSVVYPMSIVAEIRVLIRRLASNQPLNIDRIAIKLVGVSAIKQTSLKSIESHSTSLEWVKQSFKDISFFPFDDEPCCNVVHSVKYLWKGVKQRASSFGFRVSKCGSERVQEGIYLPTSEDTEDPIYLNRQGYMICRRKRALHASCCVNDEANTTPSIIFVWYILNVKLNQVYYSCVTSEPWGVPPSTGWNCPSSSYGSSPPPEVSYVSPKNELDQEIEKTDSKSNLNVFPIPIEAFRNLSGGKPYEPIQDENDNVNTTLKFAPLYISNRRIVSRSIDVFDIQGIDTNSILEHTIFTPFQTFESVKPYITQKLSLSISAIPEEEKFLWIRNIRDQTEKALSTSVVDNTIDNCCKSLRNISDKQAQLLQHRKYWLDNATGDDLLKGFEDSRIELDSAEIKCDNDTFTVFEERWRLDSILKSLQDPRASSSNTNQQQEDYISIITGIAEGIVSGYANTDSGPADSGNDQSSAAPQTPVSNNPHETLIDSPSLGSPMELFDSFISDRCLKTPLPRVQILGAELWPPIKEAESRGLFEQIHYVIEIRLSEVRTVPVSMESDNVSSDINGEGEAVLSNEIEGNIGLDTITITSPSISPPKQKPRSVFTPIREELVRRLHASSAISRTRSLVLRHDLPAIAAFHTELTHLLRHRGVIMPEFPDPVAVMDIQDGIKQVMMGVTPLSNQVSGTNSKLLSMSEISASNHEGWNKKKLRYGQPFIRYGGSEVKVDSPVQLPSSVVFDQCMYRLQQYLCDVFALFDYLEDESSSHTNNNESDSSQIQQLVVKFLTSTELPEVVSTASSPSHNDKAEVLPMYQLNSTQSLMLISPLWQSSRPPWIGGSGTWEGGRFPSSSTGNGVLLRLLFHSIPQKTDEEMLRLQRGRCAGCGGPLVSTLFRLGGNYAPCRFTGGLYCLRWCHRGDRRPLPQRMVADWDSKPHQVCRFAAAYLDDTFTLPIINVDVANPLLYDGLPTLRQVKLFRRSITALLDRAMSTPAISQYAAGLLNASLERRRLHLCFCSNFFSMEDLIEIGARDSKLLDKLVALYDKLRDIVPRKVKGSDSNSANV